MLPSRGSMRRLVHSVAGLSLALGCRAAPVDQQPSALPEPAAPQASTAASAVPLADAAPALAPLEETLLSLAVAGFRDAIVSVPTGATEPRPVVVALHGNFDRPEWQCEVMREISDAYAFVLCPRGIRRTDVPKSWDRWEYGALQTVKQELAAGLAALGERFAGYVAEGPVVFTGFSLGAILGRPIVRDDPARFPRVVFTEGGSDGWDFQRFKQGGGLRVLFACAQAGCPQNRRAVARQAERFGVEVRVADGGNAGHTYDGPVARAIKAEWAWLVEGDARWTRQGAR
jgi:hypothetical protein